MGLDAGVLDAIRAQLTSTVAPTWATPGTMATALDRNTIQTDALELIDTALVEVASTPDGRLIVEMPPQEGKSQRITRRFCTWALRRNPNTRIAIASYEDRVARRWGRVIRDDIRDHAHRLNLHVRRDLSSQSEWQLVGYDGGVVTVGMGGGLTGRPVDLLVIDDPIKDRRQADSALQRQVVWDWWLEVGATRLAPGAPVVLVLTRWHEDDLAGRLMAAEDGHRWTVLRIPAQADHDPAAGETDPLGREPGEFLASARRRTIGQWEAIKVRSGSRTWQALYQGRPSSAEGEIFKREWWQRYDQPLWVTRDDGTRVVTGFDEVIQSWDLAFKDTDGSDYVAGQVWARRGADCYLLDQVHGRLDFPATCDAIRQLSATWPQATLKLVEEKANGAAVIASLSRTVFGIVPEVPREGKVGRAVAVAPLVEAGNVWLPAPEVAPWIGGYLEELAGFPNASHDDQVDATTQALNRLILQPLASGELFTAEDLDPTLADHGSYLPSY